RRSGDERSLDGTNNHYPSYRRSRRSAPGQVLRFIGRSVPASLPVKRFVRFASCRSTREAAKKGGLFFIADAGSQQTNKRILSPTVHHSPAALMPLRSLKCS